MELLFLVYVDGLVNTGQGTAGDRDPYWKIIYVPIGTTGFTVGSNAIIMTPEPLWASSSAWPSKYIGVTANGGAIVPVGTYMYQLSFASASYYSTSVAVYFLVDNAVTSVEVSDGSAIIQTITSFTGNSGFKCFSSFILSAFGPTTTVLTFTVLNADSVASPAGLLVQFGEFNYIPGCPTLAPCKREHNNWNYISSVSNFLFCCRLSRWCVLEVNWFSLLRQLCCWNLLLGGVLLLRSMSRWIVFVAVVVPVPQLLQRSVGWPAAALSLRLCVWIQGGQHGQRIGGLRCYSDERRRGPQQPAAALCC